VSLKYVIHQGKQLSKRFGDRDVVVVPLFRIGISGLERLVRFLYVLVGFFYTELSVLVS
jgi:hypothetical protein